MGHRLTNVLRDSRHRFQVSGTCKTVSQITYTVLVETLNPAQSQLLLTLCCAGFTDPSSFVLGCRLSAPA